ncbi:hypothetical protein [Aurantimonas endophytica]|uniref:Uncharacterized protein n=1 Tax=Aurantimonas endophytica TaxID=1522175 RepID=A0A7W6HFB6_9HYPH|nr:hypothetical protein [Aurantimonas endophytica]MBB4004191.1 hypothetical protein [Aurantimonas endophytica]MCO6405034.1 hypothetical protein [Aurantimonas endophytica]
MGEIVALQTARPRAKLGERRAANAERSGKIVFLPCIRRERLVPPTDATKPIQGSQMTM